MATSENGTIRWYSEDGTDIKLDLPDGRTARVGEEPRELPRAFYKAARAAGCVATSDPARLADPLPLEPDPAERDRVILEAILAAARGDESDPRYENAFTTAGVPNTRWLSRQLRFEVAAVERDRLWAEASKILDAEEADDNSNDAGDDA